MRILAIETSCDETSVALVSGTSEQPRIDYHEVLSADAGHSDFGGIVPELAARAHLTYLSPMLARVLAQHPPESFDAVAATRGPGLIGSLIVGVVMAKTLAHALGKPFLAVNHLEGHALSPRLAKGSATGKSLPFPYLLLLVSGGHCQLLAVEAVGRYQLYGTTRDDAAGECLDKCARLLGLQPSGAALEREAAVASSPASPASPFPSPFPAPFPAPFSLPRPMAAREGCDFSFSGLKSALARRIESCPQPLSPRTRQAAAAAVQQAVVDVLCARTKNAIERFQSTYPRTYPTDESTPFTLAAAGGVAANRVLGAALDRLARQAAMQFFSPPPRLCTDNAAMIGYAALARAEADGTLAKPERADADFALPALARWSLASLSLSPARP